VSLAVTVGANWRFNAISDRSRNDWRRKLYCFVAEDEWERLVEEPIQKGRSVYRFSFLIVAALYLGAAYYLFSVAEPSLTAQYIDAPVSAAYSRLLQVVP
jgi:hypothetical protein